MATNSDYLNVAQDMISQAVGQGTGLLAQRITQYSAIAGEIGNTLRDRGEPQAAELATTIASRGQDVAEYFRERDGRALWSDFERFMEGRGWLMAGAGVIGGLLVARAIRTTVSAPAAWGRNEYLDEYAQPRVSAE